MFEALVITLREGVEGALVLAIALAILKRRGLDRLRPALLWGAAAALAASAALAMAITRATFNEELAEGIAMLIGAGLVLTLVAWMWKAAPRMKAEVEESMGRAAAAPRAILATFLFAFGMILREGAETALFLSAASFTTEGLGMWIGAALGFALAVGFGVLFVRGSVRVPLKPFFTLTSAVLLLIAIQLLIGGLHELSEAEVLPTSKSQMALIGPLVRNDLLLFTLTVAVAAGWLLRPMAAPAPSASGSLPVAGPEARLARARWQRDLARRRWTGMVAVVVVGLLATAFVHGAGVPERPPARRLPLESGVARLETGPLGDGRVHFFEAALPEGPVRFFATRIGDRIQVCFDACEICGDQGYYEEGSVVMCRNCVSPIPRATLGRSGGCNPIPLPSRVAGGVLEIQETDLRAVLPHLQGR